MSVRVRCPHCRTPCMVAEQHLGVPVKCGRCGRTFTARAEVAPAPLRLDIGTASTAARARAGTEDRFLVHHLVYCNLEERRELAVLAAAGAPAIAAVPAALTPLLAALLNGASQDAAKAAAELTALYNNSSSPAAIAVIWDGRLSLGGLGDWPIYHHNGGRLTRLGRGPRKLAVGDWLILACDGPQALDEAALQAQLAAANPSAVELAQGLLQRLNKIGGRDTGSIVVVRCY